MAKKNFDILVSNILSEDTAITSTKLKEKKNTTQENKSEKTDVDEDENAKKNPLRRTVTTRMRIDIHEKMKFIAKKEDVEIKDMIELGCLQVIGKYEEKHGKIDVDNKLSGKATKKDVNDLFM